MKKLMLINAFIWAALIIVASIFFKDQELYPYFFAILITLAGMVQALFAAQLSKNTHICKTK